MRSRKAGRTRRPKEFARRDSERTSRELEVHPCAENVQHSKRTSSRREKEDWRADESGRRPTSKRGVEPHRELISLARQRIRRGGCADPVKDLRLDSFGPLQSLVWTARRTSKIVLERVDWVFKEVPRKRGDAKCHSNQQPELDRARQNKKIEIYLT